MRHVAVVIYQLHSEFAYKVGFATVACVEKGLVRLYRIFMKKKCVCSLGTQPQNSRTRDMMLYLLRSQNFLV